MNAVIFDESDLLVLNTCSIMNRFQKLSMNLLPKIILQVKNILKECKNVINAKQYNNNNNKMWKLRYSMIFI